MPRAEGPAHRPGVLGHLRADGLDDLLGQAGSSGSIAARIAPGRRFSYSSNKFYALDRADRAKNRNRLVSYRQRMTRLERNVNLAAVFVPILGIADAVPLLWGDLLGPTDVAIAVTLY